MANSYFKFKQFIVHQDSAAMKVGTDSVLLGAWANVEKAKRALDIGTGTGLIALMMAQRNPVLTIDALEIDSDAFEQAKNNCSQSAWHNRLCVIHDSIQNYGVASQKKYDLIVSNPPYFSNSLKNNCIKKSTARHTDSLNYSELMEGVVKLLNSDGIFAVVLPSDVQNEFIDITQNYNFHLNRILNVKPTPAKSVKRILLEFSNSNVKICEEELVIEDKGRHQYSEKYKQLTRDFYLAF